ncbi:MAG: hypothetical protein P4L28_09775 [Paludibacteraceae bacterium]|nr:hypothetical protein [Paludibacteraceae bacterium]
MKKHVAIYNTREKALKAIDMLDAKKFLMEKVSLVVKENIVDDRIKIRSVRNLKLYPFLVCVLVGIFLGILTSLKVLTFAGSESLDGFPLSIRIFLGGFMGFDAGLIVGGILIIIIAILIKRDKLIRLTRHVEKDKYLIVVSGSLEDIKTAEEILNTKGVHQENFLCTYCSAKDVSCA